MRGPRTTNWDAIIASTPVDRQAALIRDGRGEPMTIEITNSYAEQPPTRPYLDIAENDITGQRFGKLVALGLGDKGHGNSGQLWVLRCDCGRYSRARAKKLRKGFPVQCGECEHFEQIRLGKKAAPEGRFVLVYEAMPNVPSGASSIACDVSLHPRLTRLLDIMRDEGFTDDQVRLSLQHFISKLTAMRKPNGPPEPVASPPLTSEEP